MTGNSRASSRPPADRETAVVPISSLQAADSPRLAGESDEHARTLSMTDSALPPILVHRDTMRVIDGMHRLRAAILNGRDEIEVRLFDGTEKDAFVAAVQANITHGLPLSLTDRMAAAARIIKSHPQWSDRAIAEAAGLAGHTVAKIRASAAEQGATEHGAQLNTRIGRDGRRRPASTARGRRIAGQVIADRPGAPLREIAKASGISLATARDVRDRVRRGDDPVPPKLALAERKNEADGRALIPGHGRDGVLILQSLQHDPAMRLSDNGRLLLRWLAGHAIRTQDWERLGADIPYHAIPLVADLAFQYAHEWRRFAEVLRRKASTPE